MPAIWHTFAHVGPRPSDAAARDMSTPVPPLRTRDWLRKPIVLREGTHPDLTSVREWLTTKLAYFLPRALHRSPPLEAGVRDALAGSLERLHIGRDVTWGLRLADGQDLSIAVIAEWQLHPDRNPLP